MQLFCFCIQEHDTPTHESQAHFVLLSDRINEFFKNILTGQKTMCKNKTKDLPDDSQINDWWKTMVWSLYNFKVAEQFLAKFPLCSTVT